jgi:SAM-dependent methyltransferase
VVASGRVGELCRRYTRKDLSILNEEEARRFFGRDPDPQKEIALAWELLYRLEPELYDRLVNAEHIHPAVLDRLPRHVTRIIEVAAGTGRLTASLIGRCDHLIAVEPAARLRIFLAKKLAHQASGARLHVTAGFFDSLPVSDGSADLVISCSALTPEPVHGGDAGLAEMERACAAGGQVVVVWPNHPEWLAEHGYTYESFPGEMTMEFANLAEAEELAAIFYPEAVQQIRRRGKRRVPYKMLGINPPRDLAYKEIGA